MLSQIDDVNAKVVLAHMGGFNQWDEVEEYLVGKNIWFDTSYTFQHIQPEQFLRIVRNHGADRILFGTDSPWGGQKECIEYLSKLELSQEELECIFWKNGASILGNRI
jgi:predicted TIM-barrel fold metal-dependent hydrolase